MNFELEIYYEKRNFFYFSAKPATRHHSSPATRHQPLVTKLLATRYSQQLHSSHPSSAVIDSRYNCKAASHVNKTVADSFNSLLFSFKPFKDFLGKWFFNLVVAWNRFGHTIFRVEPKGMTASFSLEKAPRHAKFSLQIPPLHPTRIFSRMASSGKPRRKSERRSSKIN